MDLIPWEGALYPPREWQLFWLPHVLSAAREGRWLILWAVMGAGKTYFTAELCWMKLNEIKTDREFILVTVPSQTLVRQTVIDLRHRCGRENVGMYYADVKQFGRKILVACQDSITAIADLAADSHWRCTFWVGDEAHKTETEGFKEAIEKIAPTEAAGLTATPFRSSSEESLTLFEGMHEQMWRGRMSNGYGLVEAIQDRVLTKWDPINYFGEDPNVKETNFFMLKHAVAMTEAGNGAGVISATNISDAEEYAEFLRDEGGLKALAIHSKLPAGEGEKLIRRLRSGDIDCLVHVNMLAEGVNIPEIGWMGLRRKVGAKVRFFQEFGRGLRSLPCSKHNTLKFLFKSQDGCPDCKHTCYMIDPHDLFGRFELNTPPQVGEYEKDEEPPGPPKPTRKQKKALNLESALPPATAVSRTDAWTRRLLFSMQIAGIAGDAERVDDSESKPAGWWDTPGPSWRKKKAMRGQLDRLSERLRAARWMPESQREAVKALVKTRPEMITRGIASDLLAVLDGLALRAKEHYKKTGTWRSPWPTGSSVPDAEDGVLATLGVLH